MLPISPHSSYRNRECESRDRNVENTVSRHVAVPVSIDIYNALTPRKVRKLRLKISAVSCSTTDYPLGSIAVAGGDRAQFLLMGIGNCSPCVSTSHGFSSSGRSDLPPRCCVAYPRVPRPHGALPRRPHRAWHWSHLPESASAPDRLKARALVIRKVHLLWIRTGPPGDSTSPRATRRAGCGVQRVARQRADPRPLSDRSRRPRCPRRR